MTQVTEKSANFAGCLLAIAITIFSFSPANADWLQGGLGSIPQGAIFGGREASGQDLYICRAQYKGGIHPGKIRKEFAACNISWGGREISVPIYQVAVETSRTRWEWRDGSAGSMPRRAVSGGNEANGEALFICRATVNGGTHPGKIRPGFRACNVPYGGKEVPVRVYQVMVGTIE